MLAIDGRNYKSYRLIPIGGDIADKKADFPEGDYAFAGSLAAAQRTALTQAHRRLARDHATGRTAADHEAGEERFRSAVDGILTTTQKAAIETARANTRQFLPAVRAASQAVLPPPSSPAAPGDANEPAD